MSPQEPSKRTQPCRHLDFGLEASRIGRIYISVVLSHRDCGHLLQQPQKTNTDLGTCFKMYLIMILHVPWRLDDSLKLIHGGSWLPLVPQHLDCSGTGRTGLWSADEAPLLAPLPVSRTTESLHFLPVCALRMITGPTLAPSFPPAAGVIWKKGEP